MIGCRPHWMRAAWETIGAIQGASSAAGLPLHGSMYDTSGRIPQRAGAAQPRDPGTWSSQHSRPRRLLG